MCLTAVVRPAHTGAGPASYDGPGWALHPPKEGHAL